MERMADLINILSYEALHCNPQKLHYERQKEVEEKFLCLVCY